MNTAVYLRAALGSILGLWLIGCTILPGLNISENDRRSGSGAKQYKIVQGDDNGYEVVPRGDALSVLPITPELILSERELARNEAVLTEPLDSVNVASVPPEYLIGPGDVLAVTVWEHPELTSPSGDFQDAVSTGRLVTSDGNLFYPYVGTFQVGGKTALQVRTEIARKLAKVITSPQVDVRVAAFRAQRVQVTGEVTTPGIVTLNDTPKGIIEAINERGGLSATASRRRVLLSRGGTTYLIDLGNLISGSHPALNLALRPGDLVHLPDRSGDQVFVLGEVEKQAPVIMQQDDMTLIEALTNSGGLDKLSSDDAGVLVFRRAVGADQPPKVFKLDMSSPEGLLLAGEFRLRPRDVVYVKATAFSKYNSIINQILPTVQAIFLIDRLTTN